MAIDTSMYGGLLQKPKSIAEYDADRLQLQQAQQQNRLADLVYGEKQREIGGDNALASLLAGGKSGADVSQGLAAAGYGNKSMAYTKALQEQEKQKAEVVKTKAEADEKNLKAAQMRIDTAGQTFKFVKDSPTAENAYAAIDHLARNGIYTEEQAAAHKAVIAADPSPGKISQLADMAFRAALAAKDQLPKTETRNLGGTTDTLQIDPVSGKVVVVNSAKNTMTPGEIAADAREKARIAQAERHFQVGQNTPQYMETEGGIVALPKKLSAGQVPTGVPVMGTDGQPLSKPLKAIPATVNTAIIANNQSLSQLDRTIALLEGKDQGSQKGDKDATGIKGYLPQQILNVVDPKGVEARAGVADIGSLKLHDRSGAAVTASESPRLMPFIPLTTDSNETALKKLRRLRQEVATESDAISQTYSRDQGYKPSPLKPASSGGIPSGWSVKEH